MTLKGENLYGLIFFRVETMLVARDDLDRRDHRRHPHRHREHGPHLGRVATPQEVPGADRADHQCRCKVRSDHRVHEPVGEAGGEDHVEPAARGDELALSIDRVTGGRLHPAVGGEDPES